jgi:hypothetical protein
MPQLLKTKRHANFKDFKRFGPNRIERIQSFKGSVCVLAQLFQLVATAQIFAHFYLDLEHVLVNFYKNLLVSLFGYFVYDTVF